MRKAFWVLLAWLVMLPWVASAQMPTSKVRVLNLTDAAGDDVSGVMTLTHGVNTAVCRADVTAITGTGNFQLQMKACDVDHLIAGDCDADADTSIWWAGTSTAASGGAFTDTMIVSPRALSGDTAVADAEKVGPLPPKFLIKANEAGGDWTATFTIDCMFWNGG